jgi:hypothetical protein
MNPLRASAEALPQNVVGAWSADPKQAVFIKRSEASPPRV